MNKRLVWNFELRLEKNLIFPQVEKSGQHLYRWESRFFWPSEDIITLQGLNASFLYLSNYQIKHREDSYYLLPQADYNLKIRHDQLFYKPIFMKKPQAVAYGKKIALDDAISTMQLPSLHCETNEVAALIKHIKNAGTKVQVQKEALLYSFNTTPVTKLELARLSVANRIYFSASVESRSFLLVEALTHQLIGDAPSSDYVTFLKGLKK